MKQSERGNKIFSIVKVYQCLHQQKDIAIFQIIRMDGDFLDQLGFTRGAAITIYQEGNKLVILREPSNNKDTGSRETYTL